MTWPGDSYYKYRRGYGVDPGYPKPLRYWKNLPSRIDDAYQTADKQTVFLANNNMYTFDDDKFQVNSSCTVLMQLDCSRHSTQHCRAAVYSKLTTALQPLD